jgi:hypothetical protein
MDNLSVMKAVKNPCVVQQAAATSSGLVAFPDGACFPETKRKNEKRRTRSFHFAANALTH